MSVFYLLKISIPLPGLAEPDKGWHPAFTQDFPATGAYHEITREGLLVRLPAGNGDEGSPEEPPAAVLFTGDVRFDAGIPGGTGGTFAVRLDEGHAKWAERLDYARFEGRSRLYYAEGRPLALTDDEYRERRRADHEEALTEDHTVSALAPRAASDGGGVMVETRSGARFRVAPEGDLPLPKPGDEVLLYLSPGRAHAPSNEVVGVALNGEPVYYRTPEEHARRRAARQGAEQLPNAGALQAWSELWSPADRPGSYVYGSTASEGTIFLSPEIRREAERRQEAMEDANLLIQEETLRLMGHALNLSHSPSSTSPTTGPLLGGTAGEAGEESRPMDPWTGRPLDEGGPETD